MTSTILIYALPLFTEAQPAGAEAADPILTTGSAEWTQPQLLSDGAGHFLLAWSVFGADAQRGRVEIRGLDRAGALIPGRAWTVLPPPGWFGAGYDLCPAGADLRVVLTGHEAHGLPRLSGVFAATVPGVLVPPAGYVPLPVPVAAGQTFSDVPPSHPLYPFIEAAASRGILSGYADGTFRPAATVTRAQAAKMIVLATSRREG